MIKIEAITADSPHLATVMALHRANGRNLGMFPKGAFQEHAAERLILLALTDAGECVGYLLYRVARERAAVVHLCVRSDFRRKGVAQALVDRLKSDTKHLRGIGLYCRRDYEVNAAWPKFGFAKIPRHCLRTGCKRASNFASRQRFTTRFAALLRRNSGKGVARWFRGIER